MLLAEIVTTLTEDNNHLINYIEDYISAWSLKKGKGKRVDLILPPTWQWLGSNARIEKDGSVILFEKDSYTPQELWNNSKERIDLVSGVN